MKLKPYFSIGSKASIVSIAPIFSIASIASIASITPSQGASKFLILNSYFLI